MTQSRYPDLHRHLAWFRSFGGKAEGRPVYATRDEAEEAAREESERTGVRCVVTPMWRIDHAELEDSEPVAWSFSRFPV